MNTKFKRISAALAAAAALGLSACSTAPSVVFDSTRPWHDADTPSTAYSYEKLEYSVKIYDTTAGSGEAERKEIADGSASFTLDEAHADGTIGYTHLDTAFTVTYNADAGETDGGLTDKMTSHVEFQTDSLTAKYMTKTVTLAPREGKTDLSYTVTADYFGTHKAERVMYGKTDTLDIPQGTYNDNEMMFHLARATPLALGASPVFYMTNIFDSFINGSLTKYSMTASCGKELIDVKVSESIAKLVCVPPEETEKDESEAKNADGADDTAVSCYPVSVMISDAEHGPPYSVFYSEKPFKIGEKIHTKIPVKISYSEYSGSKPYRVTEYILTSCAFQA